MVDFYESHVGRYNIFQEILQVNVPLKHLVGARNQMIVFFKIMTFNQCSTL